MVINNNAQTFERRYDGVVDNHNELGGGKMQKKYVCSKCRSKVNMEDVGVGKVPCTSCNMGFYQLEINKAPKPPKREGVKVQQRKVSEVNAVVTRPSVNAIYGQWRREKADREGGE